MIKTVMTAMLPHIRKYPEVKTGYDIYGIDVMLTRDGVPKLLEANRFPSFLGSITQPNGAFDPTKWRFEILDAVLGSVVNDVFGGIDESITASVTRLI
jgi:glutathione synthase/RimK-type ligase-like ATP-grasp enzyme